MSNRIFKEPPHISLVFRNDPEDARRNAPENAVEIMSQMDCKPSWEVGPEEAEFRAMLRRRGLEECRNEIREMYRKAPDDHYYIVICGSLHDPDIWRLYVEELGEERATMIRDAYDRRRSPSWYIFNCPLRKAREFLNGYEEGAGDRIVATHMFGCFIAVVVGYGGLLDVRLSAWEHEDA